MENRFALEKQNALKKEDKSHEQKWDKKIISLCNKINSLENYFTTSSCAGRITLLKNTDKKIPNAFLFKTHDIITEEKVKNILQEKLNEEIIYFRQEPCALHVACKTIDDAIQLLKLAKQSGWKRSGIFSTNKEKFICELCSTEWIVTPIIKNQSTEEFLQTLIGEANKKLIRTWGKIERLENLF